MAQPVFAEPRTLNACWKPAWTEASAFCVSEECSERLTVGNDGRGGALSLSLAREEVIHVSQA